MRIYRFDKGLRLDKPEWELEAGEVPELTNFVYGDKKDLLRKRRGLTRVVLDPVGPEPIRGLRRSSVNGSDPHTLVVSGGSLYKVSDQNPDWDLVYSDLSANNRVRFDAWKEREFFVTGEDPLFAWDGSDVVSIDEAPVGCRFIQQFADRLFVGSSDQFPDTLFYSDLLDYETWSDPETDIDNLIDVSPGDDQRITAIRRTREQLTIFKTHSTYCLRGYDPEEWELRRISDGVGCIAPDSVVEIDGRTIWLSARGVYMDDGVYFYRIGAAIQPFISQLPMAQQEKAVATVAGWNYYIFFPETPEGPVGFVYNVRLEAWVKWTLGVPIGCVCPKNLPTDNPGWIGGDASEGYIYYGETGGIDEGSSISATIGLPEIGTTTPEVEIDLRRVALDASVSEGDEMTLVWSVDDGPPYVREFTGSKPQIYSTPVNSGQRVRISVEVSGVGEGSLIQGIAADVRVKRRVW